MKTTKSADAWELFNSGKYEEAIPLLRAAAEALQSAENWNDLGACEFKANLPEAETSFRRALELDPYYHLAQLNLGVLLAGQRRYAEALPLLENARNAIGPAERAAIVELLQTCRKALPLSLSNRMRPADPEHPLISFVVGDFGANGLSEANASEGWMLYSALRASRPAWDVRFVSIEHDARHVARDDSRGIELIPVDEATEYLRQPAPGLLHIVYPWLKFIPDAVVEEHAVIMTLVGANPAEHCTPRDLEKVRHAIAFGRLVLVCESERAQEVLDQHDIKCRAMIPPVVPLPPNPPSAYVPETPRQRTICGFATSPYLPEHWEPRGLPLLLDLARVSPDTQFLLAWRSSPEKIEREISSRRLENVRVMPGRLDMEQFFAGMDILLLPFGRAWGSHGCPLSGVEALLRGKPVLATEHVGIAEWLRQEGCGVVTAPTVAALRSGLLHIVAHYAAYTQQARLAARRRFNPDANAAAYLPIYAEMLESAKGPTLAEWEAETRSEGKELVRGRDALASYYTHPEVANSYIATRFSAPPFAQLNEQELTAIPKLIRAKFGSRTDLKLLDFASGTGRLIPALQPFGAITALDGSAAMLAARDASGAGPVGEQARSDVRCIEGDVFNVAIHERFHVLTCGRFLRHFEYGDRKSIYRRFRELLRPDGIAIVDVPEPQFEYGIRDRTGWGKFPVYDVFWTLGSFRDELQHNGFHLAGFVPIGANIQLYEGQPHPDEACYYLVSFEPAVD